MTVNISDIEWDEDAFKEIPPPPRNVYDVELDIPEGDDVSEYIAEWLSDTYGHCINGFNYEVV